MSHRSKTVIAFDLYGTLLSTSSISKQLASHFGDEKAGEIATTWRKYQLEYTWRMNSMSLYKPFSDLTLASLKHALAEHKASLSESEIKDVMKAYDSLEVFPDVVPGLEAVKALPWVEACIFSNGTEKMLSSSLTSSPSLSPYSSNLFPSESLISIDSIQTYKPSPKTYHHLARCVSLSPVNATHMASIWLVSSNPFDIVGARNVGLNAVWVNREMKDGEEGGGWCDGLGGFVGNGEGKDGNTGGPTLVVKGVDEAVKGIEEWVKKSR